MSMPSWSSNFGRCSGSEELRGDGGPWNVIDAFGLLDAIIAWHLDTNSRHLAIANKWHRATAVCILCSHRVDAGDHCNDTTIQEEESKPPDGENAVEEDLVLWLPLNVTIL